MIGILDHIGFIIIKLVVNIQSVGQVLDVERKRAAVILPVPFHTQTKVGPEIVRVPERISIVFIEYSIAFIL